MCTMVPPRSMSSGRTDGSTHGQPENITLRRSCRWERTGIKINDNILVFKLSQYKEDNAV